MRKRERKSEKENDSEERGGKEDEARGGRLVETR